ncbi:hypothetical protein LJC26_00115 [Desulfovibrio sp. OttesenSCG-928-O18]|nr:hypothetical protein [Desulfovibrio sp. OttesenSCG-928-O18]
MSSIPYLGETTDIVLGQEFLTWLWFRSDSAPVFKSPDNGQEFTVSMEQRIVVQGGEGDAKETASVSGVMSELREARMGLTTGKQVARALVRFTREPEEWQVTLKAADMSLGSLKTPSVEKGDSPDDDPDALFFEKIHLTEVCLSFLDAIYAEFLELRLSRNWEEETKNIREWAAREA